VIKKETIQSETLKFEIVTKEPKCFHSTLYKTVHGKVRYYSLAIYLTLFGEYLLLRCYGSTKNKKPSRSIKSYYKTLTDARIAFFQIIYSKKKRGYASSPKNI